MKIYHTSMESLKHFLKLKLIIFLTVYLLWDCTIHAARKRRSKVRLRGPPGMPGLPGPKGKRGWIGRPGRQGKVGEPGPRGQPGLHGIQGKQGIKGYQGVAGADGGVGPAGPPFTCSRHYKPKDCIVGSVGYTGLPGISGGKGKIGPIGHKGEMGPIGATGTKGKRGRFGRPGSRGLLTEIKCRNDRTRFMRPMRYKKGRHSFGCNETRVEFLRGFEIETNGDKIRYRYRCCWFINVLK